MRDGDQITCLAVMNAGEPNGYPSPSTLSIWAGCGISLRSLIPMMKGWGGDGCGQQVKEDRESPTFRFVSSANAF
jgi:hypothetical protein